MLKFFYWTTKICMYLFLLNALSSLILLFFQDSNDLIPGWFIYLSSLLTSLFFSSASFVCNKYIENIWYQEQAEETDYVEMEISKD